MQQNKICWARVSKNICYFLAPIFGFILIACIAGLIIMDTDIELKDTTNYYDSKLFSNSYLDSIYEPTKEELKTLNVDNYYASQDIQEDVNIGGKIGKILYDNDTSTNFKYLIIDTEKMTARTNLEHTMKTDTIEEIKDIIAQNSIYWNFKQR